MISFHMLNVCRIGYLTLNPRHTIFPLLLSIVKVWWNTRLVGPMISLIGTDSHLQLRYFRRYGVELGRLGKAHTAAKKAYDVARRGKIGGPVLQDAQVRRNFSSPARR